MAHALWRAFSREQAMWAHIFRFAVQFVAGAMGIVLVGGCTLYLNSGKFCIQQPELDRASYYSYRSRADGMDGYLEPPNAWVERPSLADFLRPAVAQGGAEQLVAQYGFKCAAATNEACPDCRICTRTVPTWRFSYVLLRGDCRQEGEIFIQAHVGPGAAVRAMTYWKTWAPLEVRAPGGHMPPN